MCKAGTRKNATGRSTPKTEHARTNYKIVPKSRANFEKILFRFFVWEMHTHPRIKIFNPNFYIGAFQIFLYSHRHTGAYRKNQLQIRRKFLRFIFQKFRVYFVWVAGTFKVSIKRQEEINFPALHFLRP